MNYDLCLHLDARDPAILALVLRNAENYLNGLPGESFRLDVVANGGGAPLFAAEGPEFAEAKAKVAALIKRGVRFKLCANALAEHGIDHARLWPGCQVVPAGLVEVVRLQREGFAYIKP
ncbi:MAG: hypothetical protein HDQ92_03990 [Desulfovibrio sp.]|nr:hypothetical protein [Desulfovibrio sp.]